MCCVIASVRRPGGTWPSGLGGDSGCDVGITFVQACCCFELLRSRLEKWSDLRDVASPLGAAARHLEVDGYTVQCVTNIVSQLPELGRPVEIIHCNSIAEVGVVRRRFHDREIRVRHLAMLHWRMNMLRDKLARVVNVQLPEQKFELVVVGLRER